jgi:hypothetical protein
MYLKSFWRRNFSRKWVFDLRVHEINEVTQVNDQTTSGRWLFYKPNKRFYIKIGTDITPQQMELLSAAHKNCYSKGVDKEKYEKLLINYLITV